MANNLRYSDGLPPKFHGQSCDNAQAHWHAFQDYVALHKLNQQAQLQRFKLTLGSDARLWIDNKNYQNVNDLKTAFINKYSGINSRDAAIEQWPSLRYQGNESLEDYATKLRRLADCLDYGDEIIKDRFLSSFTAA